jgi:hypothetical protein
MDLATRQDVGIGLRNELQDLAFAVEQAREEKMKVNDELLLNEA